MEEPSPRRRRRYDPDRRRRIAEATIRVVAREGIANASLRAIAREADVPVGSLSYHFENKDELFANAIGIATEANSQRLSDLLESFHPEVDLAWAIAHVVEEFTVRRRHELELDFELFMASRRHPDLAAESQHWIDESDAIFQRYLTGVGADTVTQVFQSMLFESVVTRRQYLAADTVDIYRHALQDDTTTPAAARARRTSAAGDAPPAVVLLSESDETATGLTSQGFQVVAPVVPGRPPSDDPIDAAVRMDTALRTLGLDVVHLVAFDCDAVLAAAIAAVFPERVASLTLAATGGQDPDPRRLTGIATRISAPALLLSSSGPDASPPFAGLAELLPQTSRALAADAGEQIALIAAFLRDDERGLDDDASAPLFSAS